MPAYGLENNFSLIYALLDGVSRAWSAARAFTRAASIPIVSGCAPPNTRRAVRVISSSCRHGLAEIIERGARVIADGAPRRGVHREHGRGGAGRGGAGALEPPRDLIITYI